MRRKKTLLNSWQVKKIYIAVLRMVHFDPARIVTSYRVESEE
jgi:hypothetical protein